MLCRIDIADAKEGLVSMGSFCSETFVTRQWSGPFLSLTSSKFLQPHRPRRTISSNMYPGVLLLLAFAIRFVSTKQSVSTLPSSGLQLLSATLFGASDAGRLCMRQTQIDALFRAHFTASAPMPLLCRLLELAAK